MVWLDADKFSSPVRGLAIATEIKLISNIVEAIREVRIFFIFCNYKFLNKKCK
jgi:hypothetical protein